MTLELETTHDIHELVYLMFNGKIQSGKISQIQVNQSHTLENPFKESSNVRYEYSEKYKVYGYLQTFKISELFKTKSELIDSLEP